jgi:hypothetical protein
LLQEGSRCQQKLKISYQPFASFTPTLWMILKKKIGTPIADATYLVSVVGNCQN